MWVNNDSINQIRYACKFARRVPKGGGEWFESSKLNFLNAIMPFDSPKE